MIDRDSPVTEDELHVYVDGELPADRLGAVEAWLASHPEDATRIAAWRAQADAIRARYSALAKEPVPERLALDRITRRGPAVDGHRGRGVGGGVCDRRRHRLGCARRLGYRRRRRMSSSPPMHWKRTSFMSAKSAIRWRCPASSARTRCSGSRSASTRL